MKLVDTDKLETYKEVTWAGIILKNKGLHKNQYRFANEEVGYYLWYDIPTRTWESNMRWNDRRIWEVYEVQW